MTVWIRKRSELDYLVEPDLFHDFFGHVPLLSNKVFADYMQGLQQYIDYAGKNDARLYFVIWPFATFANQDAIPRKVAAALEARGANVIDLTPVLRNRPLGEIVVNSTDSHPNARIHAEMAEIIFQRLSKDGLQAWFPDTPRD